MRNLLKTPTQEQIDCQHPKPILLDTGEMKEPYDWAVRIYLDLHLCVHEQTLVCSTSFQMFPRLNVYRSFSYWCFPF